MSTTPTPPESFDPGAGDEWVRFEDLPTEDQTEIEEILKNGPGFPHRTKNLS